jgi:energy-coupling factor transport system ATP-binding protein
MIEVRNLSFRYVGRREPALRHVSLSCGPGEVLLVLGPSGCGKSTLTLCLNGAIPHSVAGELTGQVLASGLDSQGCSMATLAQRVGLVFQDPEAQFCMPRVADEVAFGLENLAVPPGEMDARIDVALAEVGLTDRRDERIEHLSGGQKQRLALACALAQGAETLVFDEPTAQLDPTGAAEVVAVLSRLRATGRHAIVLVEHRLDEVMHLVDRCLALSSDGRVVALGNPREVLREHGSQLLAAGVWVPQVTELGLRLRVRPLPLTVGEAALTLAGKVASSPARELAGSSLDARDDSGGMGDSSLDTQNDRDQSDVAPFSDAHGSTRGGTADSSFDAQNNRAGAGAQRDRAQVDPPNNSCVRMRHLTFIYSGAKREALRDVSLELRGGEFVALVGPNGAGKSTLGRLVAGILKAPKGTVEAAERVGYVFQYPEHQFVANTALQDVAYGPLRQGAGSEQARALALAALKEFGLAALAEAHPFQLSLGEQRRLSVAGMLVLNPRALILDEPTFGQDHGSAARLIDKMDALAASGSLVVAITHDVKLVARARRVLALVDGRLMFDGTPRTLFGDLPAMAAVGLRPPPVWQLSERLGIEPRAVELSDIHAATPTPDLLERGGRQAARVL